MASNYKFGKIVHFLRAFYPLQLIFGHLKYNLLALSYWLILFLIVSDSLGSKFGLPYLLYSPEYHGKVSWISFLLMGFSIGGFTMAFNMYSYMKLGTKYPFLATLSRPFIKFCWNNALIPLIFSVYYIIRFSQFQMEEEFATEGIIASYIVCYLIGFFLFVMFSNLYFFPTNKDFFKLSGKKEYELSKEEPIGSFFHQKVDWNLLFKYEKDRSYIYISGFSKWRKSRSIKHYDKAVLEKVFAHNRINATFFEIVTVVSFIVMGMFREFPFFELPAGMSIILLLSIILMLFSILKSWFKYWTYPVILLIILTMNFLSEKSSFFQYENYAYGLSYKPADLVDFSFSEIKEKADNQKLNDASKERFIQILNTWKAKTGHQKPKLVIVMTSGGGSRSALWTYSVLSNANAKLNGKLARNTQLITGASGGMVGASYYRSLLLKQKMGDKIQLTDRKYKENIAKDLLNKLSVSAYSNDLFVRFQTLKIGDNLYTKDRGYAFEQQLHQNTEYIMDKPLSYFEKYEQKGIIPTMIFSPTIINNGRRLLISSQSLAFLSHPTGPTNFTKSYENIDFQTFFNENSTDSLRFSSVMRMSATFPFVLPMVSMPTYPEMQLMDAGIRDNYGGKIMLEYLFEMQDWIKENTSGVVVVQIRDTKKILTGDELIQVSLFDKLTLPFGNMYANFTRTQDFDQDEMMKIGFRGFPFAIDLVAFNLREAKTDRISLSWHLTSQEKLKIARAWKSKGNQAAMLQLQKLLNAE